MVENWKGGTKDGTLAKSLSTVSHQYLTHEHSLWDITEVLLYEGNLDTVDISALEHTLRSTA
jgi:hypothetical protein